MQWVVNVYARARSSCNDFFWQNSNRERPLDVGLMALYKEGTYTDRLLLFMHLYLTFDQKGKL